MKLKLKLKFQKKMDFAEAEQHLAHWFRDPALLAQKDLTSIVRGVESPLQEYKKAIKRVETVIRHTTRYLITWLERFHDRLQGANPAHLDAKWFAVAMNMNCRPGAEDWKTCFEAQAQKQGTAMKALIVNLKAWFTSSTPFWNMNTYKEDIANKLRQQIPVIREFDIKDAGVKKIFREESFITGRTFKWQRKRQLLDAAKTAWGDLNLRMRQCLAAYAQHEDLIQPQAMKALNQWIVYNKPMLHRKLAQSLIGDLGRVVLYVHVVLRLALDVAWTEEQQNQCLACLKEERTFTLQQEQKSQETQEADSKTGPGIPDAPPLADDDIPDASPLDPESLPEAKVAPIPRSPLKPKPAAASEKESPPTDMMAELQRRLQKRMDQEQAQAQGQQGRVSSPIVKEKPQDQSAFSSISKRLEKLRAVVAPEESDNSNEKEDWDE